MVKLIGNKWTTIWITKVINENSNTPSKPHFGVQDHETEELKVKINKYEPQIFQHNYVV